MQILSEFNVIEQVVKHNGKIYFRYIYKDYSTWYHENMQQVDDTTRRQLEEALLNMPND